MGVRTLLRRDGRATCKTCFGVRMIVLRPSVWTLRRGCAGWGSNNTRRLPRQRCRQRSAAAVDDRRPDQHRRDLGRPSPETARRDCFARRRGVRRCRDGCSPRYSGSWQEMGRSGPVNNPAPRSTPRCTGQHDCLPQHSNSGNKCRPSAPRGSGLVHRTAANVRSP